MKFNQLSVAEVRKETETSVSVSFDVPEELAADYQFIPGQYLTLETEIDGEPVRRSYSICSHPEDGLRVAIKQVPEGVFSTWANQRLSAGETMRVGTPEGRFTHEVKKDGSGHYVAFAAGSGITPVLSILKSVLRDEPESQFVLFYGNRTTGDIIFHDELDDLKNQYMTRLQIYHLLSRESVDADLFSSRIAADNCPAYFKHFIPFDHIDEIFLCGPYDMIMAMKEAIPTCGFSSDIIKFELFFTPEEGQQDAQISASDHPHKITVTLDGRTTEVESLMDMPILDMAIEAGLDLPYSCKGGVCATCKALVRKGEVKMTTNYALDDDEVEEGYVLTCQSHPLTEEVHVDFDE